MTLRSGYRSTCCLSAVIWLVMIWQRRCDTAVSPLKLCQGLQTQHHFILISMSDEIPTAGCSCVVGPVRPYSHAAVPRIFRENTPKLKLLVYVYVCVCVWRGITNTFTLFKIDMQQGHKFSSQSKYLKGCCINISQHQEKN